MKKLFVLLTVILACLALAACGDDATTDNGNAGLQNPVTECTAEEVATKTGFSFTLPEQAENAVYSVIDGDPVIAQAVFDWEGHEVTYRICAAVEYSDMSGLYYDWENAVDWQIQGRPGHVCYNEGAAGFCGWYDVAPGVLYNVAVTENATADLLTEVADAVFVPVQGEV